jgi:hypothetical protein
MSRGARWTLGAFSLLFSGIFVATSSSSARPYIDWICAAFCVVIALACFSTVARRPSVRVVGAVVFLLYCGYLVLEVRKGLWRPYRGQGSEHWINAVRGLFVYGLPGLYVALRGLYPPWGLRAEVFRGPEHTEDPSVRKSSADN